MARLRKLPAWRLVVALITLALVLVVVAISLSTDQTIHPVANGSSATPTPVETVTASTADIAPVTPSSSTDSTSTPSSEWPTVAPAAPVSVTFTHYNVDGTVAFAKTVKVGTVDAYKRPGGKYDTVIPSEASLAALQVAAWWREQPSFAPQSPPSGGSTDIFGHACPKVACAFNLLDQMRNKDKIVVRTSDGIYTLLVQGNPQQISKTGPHDLANSSIYDKVPGVFWFVTCGYARNPHNGDLNSPYNWVVGAGLLSVQPL